MKAIQSVECSTQAPKHSGKSIPVEGSFVYICKLVYLSIIQFIFGIVELKQYLKMFSLDPGGESGCDSVVD